MFVVQIQHGVSKLENKRFSFWYKQSSVQKKIEKYAEQSGVNMSGVQIQNLQSPIRSPKNLLLFTVSMQKVNAVVGVVVLILFSILKTKNNELTVNRLK